MNKHFEYSLLSLVVFMLLFGCSDDNEPAEPIVLPDEPPVEEVVFNFPVPADNSLIVDHQFKIGSLFSFQGTLRNGELSLSGGTSTETYNNKPLFNANASTYAPADENEWWDNLVEEMEYSGLDYVAANCRGRLPKADTDSKYNRDHGDPTRLKDFLAALKRRSVKDLKVAIFDDTPASWASARNFNLYGVYTYRITFEQQQELGLTDKQVLYPLDNLEDIYKYIWDYNIKLAFDNFYGENAENNKYLFRFQGKPVLYLWNVNGFLAVNYAALGNKMIDCTGKLKTILAKIHDDFKARYNEDVFICADKAFTDRDAEIQKDASVLQAVNGWFVAHPDATNRSSWSATEYNNVTLGMCVPGFSTGELQDFKMFFDSNHGKCFTSAFNGMIAKKTDLVIVEGFTDMLEDAALWRSTDTKYYDFPNQRLNILRKYNSTRAYPESLRVEAESCDTYLDKSTENKGGSYRAGSLDVYKVAGSGIIATQWYVGDTEAGEWLEWKELPYDKGTVKISLRYATKNKANIVLEFGEGDNKLRTKEIELPATGGIWKTEEIFTEKSEQKGWRRTVIEIVSGTPQLDYFIITNEKE